MIDIISEIDRVHRELRTTSTPQGKARTVLVRRTYDTDVADVWDACTTAERIGRWLAPVTGELKLGGRYQLEGNAGGEILRCEPPKLLKVSWVFGEGASEVEVRLTDAGAGQTELELEHLAVDLDPGFWKQFGPGAVGVGWDLSLLGLAAHLAGDEFDVTDNEALLQSPELIDFMTRSGRAWGAAHEASGADADEAKGAADRTIAFYTITPEGDA